MSPTPSFEWYTWVVQHVLSQDRPIPTPMHGTHPVRSVIQLPTRHLRDIHFQRSVSMAKQRLPQVSQAVCYVLCSVRAVHNVSNADNVQAVELVIKGD